jgi:hypothetical protein
MNESYKDKFNAAMKKFGINSLDDLKTDADKKKFFKHVDSTHTADHEEVKEETVNEIFSQSQMKQAIGIARKSSGNYTKAYNEIEKIKKGLGDEHIIQNALKRANESKENEMKQESNKYHETKPGSIQDTVAQMQVNETKSVTMRVKEFSEMVETYLNKGGVSHNLSPAVLGGGFKVLPLQAVREFIDTYNRHFLTNYKAEEFVVRDELKG